MLILLIAMTLLAFIVLAPAFRQPAPRRARSESGRYRRPGDRP